MHSKAILNDTSGVSSVISVILMVAVTVILAAVVATFALSFTGSSEVAPSGSFTAEQEELRLKANGGNEADVWVLRITYENGDTIDQERLSVTVNGERAWGVTNNTGYTGNSDGYTHESVGLWDGSGDVTAGESIRVVHSDTDKFDSDGEQYSILPDGGDDPDASELYHTNGYNSGNGPQVQLAEGDTVRVTWESSSGGETAVLFEQTIQ